MAERGEHYEEEKFSDDKCFDGRLHGNGRDRLQQQL